ncbi:MAG TPA: MFS transporter [Hyphomonadaceae bacterium]|nr:MFS transporter [Hyphomonadaceae bacterium]
MSTGTATAGTAPSAVQRTPAYSWIVVSMLMFIYIFNFLDRQLMSTLQESIKGPVEKGGLNLTDSQLGLMTGLYFAIFYTGFGVVVGFLADRTSRRNILFVGCALWSGFTSLCGMAQSYPVMLTARIGVGVGEAAGAPPSYSIVSDYFPAEKRGLALALFSMGVPLGQALGAAFGARIDAIWGWRTAFIGIGVAGIIAAFLLLLVVREPKRGASDVKLDTHMEEAPTQAVAKSGFFQTLSDFFGRPVMVWTALGCGLTAFVGYAALNWNASFLIRVKHMTREDLSVWYAGMVAVAMGLGTILSGPLVDWLVKRSRIWYALVPAIAVALSVPFWFGYVWAPDWPTALAFLAGPTFLTIMYLAPALAVVQNYVKPAQRTMAGAVLLMVLNIIGLGGGPTFVGMLSTMFSSSLEAGGVEKAAAGVQGLTQALYWVTPFYAVTVLFLAMEAMALKREEKAGGAVRDGGLRIGLVLALVGFGGLYWRYTGAGIPDCFINFTTLGKFGTLDLVNQINAVMDVVIGLFTTAFAVFGPVLAIRALVSKRAPNAAAA